jgi:probable selenium-dependent hydroxylase accessory protein YqeC
VIPAAATLVVVVMGLDAVGRSLAEVAHRPEAAAALGGVARDDIVTADLCALVLGHPDGGLRGVPARARVAVALTKARPGDAAAAAQRIATLLRGHDRIERVVAIPNHAGT